MKLADNTPDKAENGQKLESYGKNWGPTEWRKFFSYEQNRGQNCAK